jgi:hypothetical protein
VKIGGLLVILAIVLGVLGAGLSYSGYSESLHEQTVTSTQTYAGTTTKTIASTSTETFVVTSSSELAILDQDIVIDGIGNGPWAGMWDYAMATLDVGKVNVGFSADNEVDFYMFTEDQFKQWEAKRFVENPAFVNKLAHERGTSYQFTKDMQTGGTYYFVFENKNKGPVSITLHVDAGMRTDVLTETREHVQYSTQTNPFVTETVSSSTQPVGLGLLFYSGIGLLVVAAVVIAFSRMKSVPRRGAPALTPTYETPPTPAAVPPPPPVAPATRRKAPAARPPTGKFCINCGASLSADAKFCGKCGSRQ